MSEVVTVEGAPTFGIDPKRATHVPLDQDLLANAAEEPPSEDGPVGACWMRCCGTWEEDENAIDWPSDRAGNGFVHYRCPPR